MIDRTLADHLLLSDSQLECWLLRYSRNCGEGSGGAGVGCGVVELVEVAVEMEVAVESLPPMDPAPSRLLDPDLLAAFLAEPVPLRIDLGPSAILPRNIVGGVPGRTNDESASGRTSKRGNDADDEDAGGENADEDDTARDTPENGDDGGDNSGDNGGDNGGDDSGDELDMDNILSERDVHQQKNVCTQIISYTAEGGVNQKSDSVGQTCQAREA